MGPDTLVLLGFVALALASACGVILYFWRLRLQRLPRTWARILTGNLLNLRRPGRRRG